MNDRRTKPATPDRLHPIRMLVPGSLGLLEALLTARLLARLLAARPDNPAIEALYRFSAPFIQPLTFLDVQQPDFGAVLELSTLTLVVAIPIIGYCLWLMINPAGTVRATLPPDGSS